MCGGGGCHVYSQKGKMGLGNNIHDRHMNLSEKAWVKTSLEGKTR